MQTQTPTLPAGIDVRPARPPDLPGLRAMVERCSPDTLHRRFHGVMGSGARRELERIAHPTPAHRSWVAVDAAGHVHGTSTLAWSRTGEVEVAFLVEDAWQRRGLGRALVQVVGEEAQRAGLPRVEAIVQPDNRRALHFLRAVAPGLSLRFADGSTVATIALAAPAAAVPPIGAPVADGSTVALEAPSAAGSVTASPSTPAAAPPLAVPPSAPVVVPHTGEAA